MNLALWPLLPEAFQPAQFDRGVPGWLLWLEDGARTLVFGLPVAMRLRPSRSRLGSWLLIGGATLYLLSWLALIVAPASGWSTSLAGFSAPAFLPLLWLVGMALSGEFYGRIIAYRRSYYLLPSLVFVGAHVTHAAYTWQRLGIG